MLEVGVLCVFIGLSLIVFTAEIIECCSSKLLIGV